MISTCQSIRLASYCHTHKYIPIDGFENEENITLCICIYFLE